MDPIVKKIVKSVVENKMSPTLAICRAMGYRTVNQCAQDLGWTRVDVCHVLLGMPSRVYPEMRDAIAAKLGISRKKLDAMILELSVVWERIRKE